MKKCILITGLDGSGKSTFFERIEQNRNEHFEVLRLPIINMDNIPKNNPLYTIIISLNALNKEGDIESDIYKKGLALFGSMIIFSHLTQLNTEKKIQFTFCERHPLIDSFVYSQFYAPRMDPSKIDPVIVSKMDENYSELIRFLISLIPSDFSNTNKSSSLSIFNFIYQNFSDTSISFEKLENIFNTRLPDKIYFLKAAPEILYERLENRKIKEAHENPQILAKLNQFYITLLNKVKKETTTEVTIINAESFEELDLFYQNFIKQYV